LKDFKKVLIVAENFYPEEFRINDLVLELKNKGFKITVITQKPTYPHAKLFPEYENKWFNKSEYEGITIYRVKAITNYNKSLFKKLLKYFTFAFLGSIVGLFIGRKYEHVFSFQVGSLICAIPATIVSRVYNIPSTIWTQDVWPDTVYAYGFKKTKLNQKLLDGFIKYIYHSFTNVVVSGPGFIKKLQPYARQEQEIQYLPNWAEETEKFIEKFQFSDTKKIQFTFAGNIGKLQNLENVIQAFGSMLYTYKDKAQLNIIGDGSNFEYLKKLAKSNNYTNIVFWGRQPSSQMPMYFEASDFLIISLSDKPILSLVIPLKFQSYLVAKKPIFGVLNGEVANMIKEYNLGYCTHPDNLKEIIEGFHNCIDTTPKMREQFIKNSEILLNKSFSRDKIINKFAIMLAS